MHQKYKANENTSRHKPKKKQKQTINKNQVKTHAKRAQEAACMLLDFFALIGPKKAAATCGKNLKLIGTSYYCTILGLVKFLANWCKIAPTQKN
jgi:hypothetical protein